MKSLAIVNKLLEADVDPDDPIDIIRRDVEKRSGVKKIEIWGKRWFQRTYGNTYFTANIYVNDTLIHTLPRQYGYGHHYFDQAVLWLKDNGYIDWQGYGTDGRSPSEALWQWKQRSGIEVIDHVTDVKRQREL